MKTIPVKQHCPQCNKAIPASDKKRKYCSAVCAYKATAQRASAARQAAVKLMRKDRKCIICKKMFSPRSVIHSVCSQECRRLQNARLAMRVRQDLDNAFRDDDV